MADGFKKYILMHKELSVARVVLDEATGLITAVNAVDNAEHLPLGVNVRKGVVDRAALNEWWMGRAIPASRAGLRHALEELNIATPQKLLEKCLGLSLSDQYWICPQDSGLRWKEVNFFEHPFSGDVGEVLFGGAAGEMPDLMSPDNTSDGWLRKKWVIMDGERCLVKGGSGAIQQEPYNEVIASGIMEKPGIPHVEYMLQIRDCALPGFVDSKNEEKTERNAGYLVVSQSGGGMLRQGTRKGIRRTPANRGMRAHRIVKSLDISEDVCHGLCP